MRNTCVPLLLGTLFLTACSSDEPAAPAAETPPAVAPPAQPSGGEPADPTFAPITSRQPSGEGTAVVAPGAIFTLPPGWVPEPPSSSMRLAQARIPGAAGEAQLTVFYFGPGGGGGVDANLDRWVGQLQVEPGSAPTRDTFAGGGFQVTWIDVVGTILPTTMGTGPVEPKPGSRLLGAVVEGPRGPWFFKATGPADTLAAERDAFLGVLRSATPHG